MLCDQQVRADAAAQRSLPTAGNPVVIFYLCMNDGQPFRASRRALQYSQLDSVAVFYANTLGVVSRTKKDVCSPDGKTMGQDSRGPIG
jgi:hypothetical protein